MYKTCRRSFHPSGCIESVDLSSFGCIFRPLTSTIVSFDCKQRWHSDVRRRLSICGMFNIYIYIFSFSLSSQIELPNIHQEKRSLSAQLVYFLVTYRCKRKHPSSINPDDNQNPPSNHLAVRNRWLNTPWPYNAAKEEAHDEKGKRLDKAGAKNVEINDGNQDPRGRGETEAWTGQEWNWLSRWWD